MNRRSKLRLLLKALSFLALPISVPYFLYLYWFYRQVLQRQRDKDTNLFHARDDYGCILALLYFAQNVDGFDGRAVITVFSPKGPLMRELAEVVCPRVTVNAPRQFISPIVHRFFNHPFKLTFYPLLFRHFRTRFSNVEFLYYPEFRGGWTHQKVEDEARLLEDVSEEMATAYLRYMKTFNRNEAAFLHLVKIGNRSRLELSSPLMDAQAKLLAALSLGSRPYVTLNVNTKKYASPMQDVRSIQDLDAISALIDHLIVCGFDVVLQGGAEQPHFEARDHLVAYCRSPHQTVVNDILLTMGCEFLISGKSGNEFYAPICGKPILGINFVEFSTLSPWPLLRYAPKTITLKGKVMSLAEMFHTPVFYRIGGLYFDEGSYDFNDLTATELIAAADDFLNWLAGNQSEESNKLQADFKSTLTPLHLDSHWSQAMPLATVVTRLNEGGEI